MSTALTENSTFHLAGIDLPKSEVSGEAAAAVERLVATPGMEVIVLQISPGVARDTEIGAFFVVASGRATVVVNEGDGVMFLRPGVVGRLMARSITSWTIIETLTLVCVIDGPPARRVARSAGWSRI